ncbi:MAG: hypothetical protein JSS81_13425 [Acidobacteria bacterium]|nr:hypothetical protein [Acidobacteriota bacterium]
MKRLVILIGLMLAASTLFGQTPNPSYPTNNPLPDWVYKTAEERRKMYELTGRTPDGMIADRPDGRFPRLHGTRPDGKPYTKEELEKIRALLLPAPEDLETYKAFLDRPKTGIFRLFSFYDCYSKNLIRTDGPCADFIEDSWSFSFRWKTYNNLSDVALVDGQIQTGSFFTQGLIVALGDVPLDNLSLASDGIKDLVEFKPAATFDEARRHSKKIKEGFDFAGFRFADRLTPEVGRTYALRSIAYRPHKWPPIFLRPGDKLVRADARFFGIRYDVRDDLIVVFRVIRKDADGNLTILWKELQRRDAPKIKFSDKEIMRDFN